MPEECGIHVRYKRGGYLELGARTEMTAEFVDQDGNVSRVTRSEYGPLIEPDIALEEGRQTGYRKRKAELEDLLMSSAITAANFTSDCGDFSEITLSLDNGSVVTFSPAWYNDGTAGIEVTTKC